MMDRLAAHRDRVGELLDGARFDADGLTRLRHDVLPTLTDQQALSLYVVLAVRAAAYHGWQAWSGCRLFADLHRRPLPWTAADVVLLFELAGAATEWGILAVVEAATSAAERLAPAQRADCGDAFRNALWQLDEEWFDPGERARLRFRLRVLLCPAGPAAPGCVAAAMLDDQDGWGRAAVKWLAGVTADADVLPDLLAHAATIPAGPRPTKTWLRRAGELLADRPGLVGVLRELLEFAHTCEPVEVESWGMQFPQRIGTNNADLARGLLWTAQIAGEPWLIPLVLAVHATRPDAKVRNACFAVLGRRGDPAAIAALVQLQRATRDRGELTQIAAALNEAADRAGVSRSELTEQTISDAGLDRQRQRRISGGDVTAVLALDEQAKTILTWEHGGSRSTRQPSRADPDLVAEVKRAATQLRKLVAAERDRLEELLTEEREWPLDMWRQRYADHPVTGSLAGRLLWTVSVDGRDRTGLPAGDGRFALADGEIIDPGGAARVRMWHPVTVDPDQIRRWRARIMALELKQPIKQAFREVYLLTPAEEETGHYSNRFAGHVLRYQQAYALMKERRWSSNYLGGWDGGHHGEARRDFPAYGLRAVFHHHPAGDGDGHTVAHCVTDQVQFWRLAGRNREPVPLTEIPPVVFAEAMRDVDLFVGVTSIATDPTWADRGTDGRFDYWRGAAFGDLGVRGDVRRETLGYLLPKLKIRDRARLEGNYLVVEGRKHTYKIHVGSGNILMSPNDQYLCIVPARRSTPSALRFVPFEGDETLSVVLSKALLLADDHRITDPSILRQIG